MSDISDLKASVLEQAHEKGRLLLAEATEKIEQEAKEREAQLVRQKLAQREQQLKEISRRSQRDIQQLENQKRQSTLVIKQRVLRELFEEAYAQMAAWSPAEEEHFLGQIVQLLALPVGDGDLLDIEIGEDPLQVVGGACAPGGQALIEIATGEE